MAVVDYIESWSDRLKSRLYFQFRDEASWNAWCDSIIGPQAQSTEDASETLLLILSIDDIEGVLLDVAGRIVGQKRAGLDDPTYRLYLKARIAANKSDSTPSALYRVFSLLFPGHAIRVTTSPVKSFVFHVDGTITDVEALAALDFLASIKEAAARSILEWQEQDDDETFTFAVATSCMRASSISDTTMTIDPRLVGKFTATGQVVIDGGLAAAETVSYTSIVGNVITFAAPLAKAHAIGAEVELVGDPGLGFGDTSNPLIGGDFAFAEQA